MSSPTPSWDTVRTKVRSFHSTQSAYSYPYQRDFCFDQKHHRLYFLGSERRAVSRRSKASPSVAGPPGDYNRLGLPFESLGSPRRHANRSEQEAGGKGVGLGKYMSLFAVDLPSARRPSRPRRSKQYVSKPNEADAQYPMSPARHDTSAVLYPNRESKRKKISVAEWIPLITHDWLTSHAPAFHSSLPKEEQLMKERKRISIQGITSCHFAPALPGVEGDEEIESTILFSYGTRLYVGKVGIDISDFEPLEVPDPVPGSLRIDPKIGGRRNDLISFVRDRDLYVATLNGTEYRLTWSDRPEVSNGLAEYIMQEEFRRFTGYWWRPSGCGHSEPDTHGDVERILYICTDHTDVEVIYLPRPGLDGDVDEYRYPRAGKPNVVGEPRMIEFVRTGKEHPTISKIVDRRLRGQFALKRAFPWMEYIPRIGWTPDGQGVWIQILNRTQTRTALIYVPIALFMSDADYADYKRGSFPFQHRIQVLVDEISEVWINVTDITNFFPSVDTGKTEFIWASERTGWRHLYRGTCANMASPSDDSRNTTSVIYPDTCLSQLTFGEWAVLDHPIAVDPQNRLVYFSGKKDIVLETHLYVCALDEPPLPTASDRVPIKRLTPLGASHCVKMDETCTWVVNVWSSFADIPRCDIGRILSSNETADNRKPDVHDVLLETLAWARPRDVEFPLSKDFNPQELARLPVPEVFSFFNSEGVETYGLLYRPDNYREGQRYPTLLRVYGGPNVQVVTNDYKHPKFTRVFLALKLGFCVLLVDGRGSADRGLKYESALRHKMGTVELRDQIEALMYLAIRDNPDPMHLGDFDLPFGDLAKAWTEVKEGILRGKWGKHCCLDLERIAVTGWSYGGYLALMALAQFPTIINMCLSGAPVTCWELYDTAYTERYMGLPEENEEGYRNGRVVEWVEGFPDSENRLLIVHGLQDENVHFKNTEVLISALVKHSKPHQVQVYPSERHGLRQPTVVEHFETLMFWWLGRYL
ncbi:hypothetical protein SpCBS45565_g00402 [Spizellomyces sp. 'palustris']|nr:hypothetical protein SpCBS45565_g00402 [Spizellomyces sp. 'palustris']